MKKFLFGLLALLAISLLPMVALADPVSVVFTGVGGGISDPALDGTQYYIAPYILTVNGVSENAFCVDFNHEITFGQTWTANTTLVSGPLFNLTYQGNQLAYLEMGYLASIYNSNPGNQAAIQQAVWDISVGNGTKPFNDASTLSYVSQAYANANGWNTAGWIILTDTRNSAQEFLIQQPVPEPGSLMLLGIGIVGIAFMRKKQKT